MKALSPASELHQWALVVVSFTALVFAYCQLAETRRLQNERFALDAWQKYLEISLQYRREAAGLRTKRNNMNSDSSAEEVLESEIAYDNFFALLGTAGEALLFAFPKETGWRRTVLNQICIHERYLKEMPRDDFAMMLETYRDTLNALILDAREGRCPVSEQR